MGPGPPRRRRRCPRPHFGLYDDFNPNSITLTSLSARERPTDRPSGTCFLRAPSSLKLTSSSFKLYAGNNLGGRDPHALITLCPVLGSTWMAGGSVIVQVWIIAGGCDTFTKWQGGEKWRWAEWNFCNCGELSSGPATSAPLILERKWPQSGIFRALIFVARQIPGEENWEKRRERGIKLFSTRHVVGLGALEGMLLGSVRRL